MALEQQTFHIVVEILAIIISIYFIYLSKEFKGWKRYALIIIATGVIIIDVIALLGWAKIITIPLRVWFHILTEALAIPAGIILIYLSTEKINNPLGSKTLLIMGIANLVVDGFLISTWFF
jgi:hypothetical protein